MKKVIVFFAGVMILVLVYQIQKQDTVKPKPNI